jgi:hypothetical protein
MNYSLIKLGPRVSGNEEKAWCQGKVKDRGFDRDAAVAAVPIPAPTVMGLVQWKVKAFSDKSLKHAWTAAGAEKTP